ncbi:MAG: hypothetical protein QM756_45100 [Polyangiaceae bacterium]
MVRLFELTERQEQLIDELHDLELPAKVRDEKWTELMKGTYDDAYKWTYTEYSVW